MKRTQVYLPKNQIDELRKIARKKQTSVSDVIRVFIKERTGKTGPYLKFHPSEKLFDAAKRISKLSKGGAKDVASNLDAYLYGGKQ